MTNGYKMRIRGSVFHIRSVDLRCNPFKALQGVSGPIRKNLYDGNGMSSTTSTGNADRN